MLANRKTEPIHTDMHIHRYIRFVICCAREITRMIREIRGEVVKKRGVGMFESGTRAGDVRE